MRDSFITEMPLLTRQPGRLLDTAILRAAAAGNRAVTWTLQLRGATSKRVVTAVGRVHVIDIKGTRPGPTWVLLHGFGAQALNWYHLLGDLRRACGRILLVDLPGHGSSDIPPAGINEEALLDYALAVVRGELSAAERVVVMGNSMGGFAAVRLVHTLAEQAVGMVLISPFGSALSPAEVAELMELFSLADWRRSLAFVDRLFVNGTPLRQAIGLLMRANMNQPHLRRLLDRCNSFTPLTEADLARLPQTLLIWGKQDRILPASGRAFFVRCLPQETTVIEPENYGHSPFLDLGSDVAERVLGWARGRF